MDTYFIDQEYDSERDVKRAVIAAGYRRRDVEFYTVGHRLIKWKFRLTEEALASQAASTAEPMPRKRLADHVPQVKRRRLRE